MVEIIRKLREEAVECLVDAKSANNGYQPHLAAKLTERAKTLNDCADELVSRFTTNA